MFKLNASGRKTVLYMFLGGTDGAYPAPGLARDSAGNLYGATEVGGDYKAGTVYKLDTTGKKTVLHQFNGTDGWGPNVVILDAAGNLYGTANGGGRYGEGTIFKITP